MKRLAAAARKCRRCGRKLKPSPFDMIKTRCRKCQKLDRQDSKEKKRLRRKWMGDVPNRSNSSWKQAAAEASRFCCARCKREYCQKDCISHLDSEVGCVVQSIDHIVPWRVAANAGMDPHKQLNLMSLCYQCHGSKKPAENLLLTARIVEAVAMLNKDGFWTRKAQRAFEHYGLSVLALRKGAA